MSGNLESLIYVSNEALHDLDRLLDGLDNVDPKVIEARLRRVEETCTTLSGALKKLAAFTTELLPEDSGVNAQKERQPSDKSLLLAAQKLVKICGFDK